MARENPAAAPVAAVTAATLQPKRIAQIAKAAVAAAPSEAAKIVAALIKEFPQDYGVIAIAAADGSPSSGRAILGVVAEYVPALQSSIEGATAKFAANNGAIPGPSHLEPKLRSSPGLRRRGDDPGPGNAHCHRAGDDRHTVNCTACPWPSFYAGHDDHDIGPGQIQQQQPGGRNYSPP